MGSPRFVGLDPDGTGGRDWLYVVVEAGTGVIYQQQYGGNANRHGQVEGFLVPLASRDGLSAMRGLFEKEFRGAGTWGCTWPDDARGRLDAIIGAVRYWDTERPHSLRLDESRMRETDEAWVPVITPDGPGVLVWANSD